MNIDGFKPTLADYIYVEALIYEFDIKQGIDDIEKNLSIHNWSSYLKDKQVEYYGLKCYETNCMECISVSKELFHTQFKQQKVILINMLQCFCKQLVLFTFTFRSIIMIIKWINHGSQLCFF